MDDKKLQDIVTAIRSMNVTDKPNVKEVEAVAGFNLSAKERDAAWQYIADHPVDEDIPQADTGERPENDKKPEDNPNKKGKTIHIKAKGVEGRCRAGHCFDETGKTFSVDEISDEQLEQLKADPYLTVTTEG